MTQSVHPLFKVLKASFDETFSFKAFKSQANILTHFRV